MIFKDWLLYRGLSSSSAEKYAGAIQGPLSQWAIESNIMAKPLISLTSNIELNNVASKLRLLPIFLERNERGHHMYSSALVKFSEYLTEVHPVSVETDIDTILNDSTTPSTERSELIKCRIGQGLFRQKLITYWNACAVTGYSATELLVASHIKPWHACTNAERLNPFNGLLLTPNIDKAFDAGLITFLANGSICISPLLSHPERFGIKPNMRVKLANEHEHFMNFHRTSVFRSN